MIEKDGEFTTTKIVSKTNDEVSNCCMQPYAYIYLTSGIFMYIYVYNMVN